MTTHRRFMMLPLIFSGLFLLSACGGSSSPSNPTPQALSLEKIGGFTHRGATDPTGFAEINAYDPGTKRLFVVNTSVKEIHVLDLANPASPARVGTVNYSSLGGGANSVAVKDGLVAVAIEANAKTDPGLIAFYKASDLTLLQTVTVGALPDMVTFSPDGKYLLVANEGEPNSYNQADSVDPEGSVSVITLNRTAGTTTIAPTVATADFKAFIGQEDALRAQGIRIYGPNANAAQDFEPEYITVSKDGKTAYVTLQENNAIAIVDIASAKVTSVKPLGYKDHSLAGFGFDASDKDSADGKAAINIKPWPVKGMYLPDGIASYTVNGATYLITANEGDSRADWPGFNEESRVKEYCSNGLDPAVFADATNLIKDANLGRLKITNTPNGNNTGKNASGQCTELYAFGARSFSIWNTDITRVYDSGDDLEQRTKALTNVNFNASHDDNTLDKRSTSKGPEPESVVVGTFGNKTFAFIGLERIGGVMVYDVTTPTAPVYVTYLNTRNGVDGDTGPEGMTLIKTSDSPNGKPLLIVGNEVSGTTAIFQINLTY